MPLESYPPARLNATRRTHSMRRATSAGTARRPLAYKRTEATDRPSNFASNVSPSSPRIALNTSCSIPACYGVARSSCLTPSRHVRRRRDLCRQHPFGMSDLLPTGSHRRFPTIIHTRSGWAHGSRGEYMPVLQVPLRPAHRVARLTVGRMPTLIALGGRAPRSDRASPP